jgi:hypothetical protein
MFRAIATSVRGPDSIQIGFSDFPTVGLTVDNFSIFSNFSNEPALVIKSVQVDGKVVTLTHSLSTPLVSYTLLLQDTEFQRFESEGGEPLQIDGVDNKFVFVGVEAPSALRETMFDVLTSVYDGAEDNLLHKHVTNLAEHLSGARSAIRQKSNSIYLQEIVTDALMVRGESYADRLPQESAFQIDRVSLRPTSAAAVVSRFNFSDANSEEFSQTPEFANPVLDSFPAVPYSLRQRIVTETVSNAEQIENSFSGLRLKVANGPVTQVLAVTLRQGSNDYPYDITSYPVGLNSNRYDTTFAYTNFSLGAREILLDPAAVSSLSIPSPTPLDEWIVVYAYDDASRNPIEGSIEIFRVRDAVRERTPAASNVFSLSKFPITDESGNALISDGVAFLDPSPSAPLGPYSQAHPAFVREIPFDRFSPPAGPGEFSVDYSTGQVLVYGADLSGIGTGAQPPVATYKYKQIYSEGVDFVFDPETSEILATAARALAGEEVTVEFRYESVLVPGVDYIAEAHNEALGEYIENRIVGNNRLTTNFSPITDAFRVFNETTGELYSVSYFNRHQVQITGTQLPRRQEVFSEGASFRKVLREDLFIATVVKTFGSDAIYSVNLQFSPVMAASEPLIGSATNTSFSPDSPYLVREMYFDEVLQDLDTNLAKLSAPGDYLLDYSTGTLYFRGSTTAEFFIGSANYTCGEILTANTQITSVDILRYAATASTEPIKVIDHMRFSNDTIFPRTLLSTTERFFNGNSDNIILFGAKQWGNLGSWEFGTDVFSAPDAIFSSDMADGNHILRLVGDSDRQIVQVLSPTIVKVDIPFTSREADVAWVLLDTDPADGYRTMTTYEARDVRAVYLVNDLQTLPAASLTNYWDRAVDRISGNVLTFNNAAAQSIPVGAALAVDYSFGSLFIDYEYLVDRLRIDYEWGDNQIRWLRPPLVGTDYFCTFRYGALRRELAENFAVMMGLPELLNADLEISRETIRDLTRATMQVFAGGPTLASMRAMAEIPTLIEPEIKELTFGEWTLGRDNLYPADPEVVGTSAYGPGRWGSGLDTFSAHIRMPSEKIVSYRNGSFFCKIRPNWSGQNNNASLTIDVNLSPDEIWLGAAGKNPKTMPFTISLEDGSGLNSRPAQFGSQTGLFIWYDTVLQQWQSTFVGVAGSSLVGTISTDGIFASVIDGYVNSALDFEVTDTRTTRLSKIDLNLQIDANDEAGSSLADGYIDETGPVAQSIYSDSIALVASRPNYIFDAGAEDNSRISIFRDESGFLVFKVIDDTGKRNWQLSSDIRTWEAGDIHSVGASWRLDSPEGQDEMHLFIDGLEVPNLQRFGHPFVSGSVFRSVAAEMMPTPTSTTAVFEDGVTVAGSATMSSASADFIAAGIAPGHQLVILEGTNDGLGSPYTILSVSTNGLVLDSALTLDLDAVRFSVNPQTYILSTNTETSFAVFVNNSELVGEDGEFPQYSVTRIAGKFAITVYDGLSAGDEVIVSTLGLSLLRCQTFAYVFKPSLPPPPFACGDYTPGLATNLYPGNISISGQSDVDLLSGYDGIAGNIDFIDTSGITDPLPLQGITEITGNVTFSEACLPDPVLLPELRYVGGDLLFDINDSVLNANGFCANLTRVVGDVTIIGGAALTALGVTMMRRLYAVDTLSISLDASSTISLEGMFECLTEVARIQIGSSS